MSKIRHGLSKCFFCTDGASVAMPGAVRLELNAATKTDISGTFNLPEKLRGYENLGYTGKLILVRVPESFSTSVYGWETENGILIEKYRNGEPTPFQLLWQVKGTGERFVLYECYADKPNIIAETDEESAVIATAEIPIYAYSDQNKNIMGHTIESTSAAVYNAWFNSAH